jgi:hypothetical protein
VDGGSCGLIWGNVVGFAWRDRKISHKTASVFVEIQIDWLNGSQKCWSLSCPECIHYTGGSHVLGAIPCWHIEIHTFKLLYSDFTYAVWGESPFDNWSQGYWLVRTDMHILYWQCFLFLTGWSARRWGTENQITRNYRSPCGCRLFQSTYQGSFIIWQGNVQM